MFTGTAEFLLCLFLYCQIFKLQFIGESNKRRAGACPRRQDSADPNGRGKPLPYNGCFVRKIFKTNGFLLFSAGDRKGRPYAYSSVIR